MQTLILPGVLTNNGTIVPGVVTAALLFNPVLPVYDSATKVVILLKMTG